MPFFVYILKCADKTYYCGYTKDIEKRVKTHNNGKGAKYTRQRRPVKVVFVKEKATLSEALKEENRIKKMSRKEKEALIHGINGTRGKIKKKPKN